MLSLFVVRNQEGKFFRAKGRSGYGETWVGDISNARLYTKLGQARSRVTFFAAKWPEYGIPDIVRLVAKVDGVVDDTDRTEKALAKRKTNKERQEVWRKKGELLAAQLASSAAKKRLADLGRPAN